VGFSMAVVSSVADTGLGWFALGVVAIRVSADIALVLLTPRKDRGKVVMARFRGRSSRFAPKRSTDE